MTKWLEHNKKVLYVIILLTFCLLISFYIFAIRSIQVEEKHQGEQLNRIKEDNIFYQYQLSGVTPQKLTENEKSRMDQQIPSKPKIEEMIKDLEKIELSQEVLIENIEVAKSQYMETDEENPQNEEGNQQAKGSWQEGLPQGSLEEIKKNFPDIENIALSYIDFTINVVGEEKDVNSFVNKLETLERAIHIQSYDYRINEERENLSEGTVMIRTYYSEEFSNLMESSRDFKLDYDFDPQKIKKYLETEKGSTMDAISIDSGTQTESSQQLENESSRMEPVNNQRVQRMPQESEHSNIDLSNPYVVSPEAAEKEQVFHVVQTGAYSNNQYMYLEVNKLIDAGIYPRIIGEEMSYIYAAADNQKASAQKISEILKQTGVNSYVKTLPYRLTEHEKKVLLKEVYEVTGAIADILSTGIAYQNYLVKEDQLGSVNQKIKNYEEKVKLLQNDGTVLRGQELKETAALLSEIYSLLEHNAYKDSQLISYWKAEGLLLDFMLVLNGYESANLK
ncbi:hypothetical protein [Cytobacillus sp. NCCP-133]|uniref:hypothetical protein n=1 Tax=Cytobacillus sp. NCCP-133 TaxID=766848 RepID=UPI002230993A|nr:hypothetical protein [Cytobacillus sp. NCCP-133]GLB58376.1 hypothetical protein NCCP133_05090 [Cytobacillus sp. NCCP-133]